MSAASAGPLPALPEWLAAALPFDRRMCRIDGRDVHCLDHGDGPAVLLVHGNPSWSFLWRKLVPGLAEAGLRVVAPDLVGFGLSEKPRDPTFHTLQRHIDIVRGLVEQLELDSLVVVGQDWGGPVAGGVAAALGERVRGAVFGNTALLAPRRPIRATKLHHFSHTPVVADLLLRRLNLAARWMHRVQGDRASIGAAERRAYVYPFRQLADRAGPLALLRMVPDREGHASVAPLDTVDAWFRGFAGPIGLVWGRRDPLLGRAGGRLRRARPDATWVETQAGHFLQEEVPEALVEQIVEVARAGGLSR